VDSEKEFEKVFEETSRMIFSLGLRLFHNEKNTLDFVQDVYLDTFRKRDQFQGRSRYSTYLYSFALHRGLNQIRKSSKIHFQQVEDFAAEPEAEEPPSAPPEIVREELNGLPEVYRLPLVLHYYEKMSVAAIAAELEQKENTVKSYMLRARKILKQKIEERMRRSV